MPAFLHEHELGILSAAVDRLIPADDEGAPGASRAGVVDYIDTLLGAFTFDPPRIFAGGPFSGRWGGEASFEHWLPLGPMEELAWRTRIEGSQGRPEREFNGPVVGLQQRYRDGLAALGPDFAGRLARRAGPSPRPGSLPSSGCCTSTRAKACTATRCTAATAAYAGWDAVGWIGDIQPRGYTDEEVAGQREDGDPSCPVISTATPSSWDPGRAARRWRTSSPPRVGR